MRQIFGSRKRTEYQTDNVYWSAQVVGKGNRHPKMLTLQCCYRVLQQIQKVFNDLDWLVYDVDFEKANESDQKVNLKFWSNRKQPLELLE